jgi:hypothetical protein
MVDRWGWSVIAKVCAEGVEVGLMKCVAFVLIAIWLSGEQAMSADGLITLRSSFGSQETVTRLEAEIHAKGMTICCHVDHAAGAAAISLSLRPTNLLIFRRGRAEGTLANTGRWLATCSGSSP